MKQTPTDYARTLYAIVQDLPREQSPSPYGFGELCQEMRRTSRAVDRVNLTYCNGIPRYDAKARRVIPTLTDSDMEALDRRKGRAITRLARVIDSHIPEMVYTLSAQGDPRGLPLTLTVNGTDYRF